MSSSTIPDATVDDMFLLTELHKVIWTQLGHIPDTSADAKQAAVATVIIAMRDRGTIPRPGSSQDAKPKLTKGEHECATCGTVFLPDAKHQGSPVCPSCRAACSGPVHDQHGTASGATRPPPPKNDPEAPPCPECSTGYCGKMKDGGRFKRCYQCGIKGRK